MRGMGRGAIVGRDAELARVRQALDAARSGTTTVLLVVGEAGMGKSSLLDAALAAGAGPHTDVVLSASGDEAEADLDYGIIEQLRRWFPRNAGVEPIEPDPEHDYRRVGAALLRVVDEATLPGALIVVVDDAQWADVASHGGADLRRQAAGGGRHDRLRRGHPARRGPPAAPGPAGAGRGAAATGSTSSPSTGRPSPGWPRTATATRCRRPPSTGCGGTRPATRCTRPR